MAAPEQPVLARRHVERFAQDGFVVVDGLIDEALIEPLKSRFERLFRGEFETGVAPDEVNWQYADSDPSLTRQICNGWRADRLIAQVVLDARLGEAIAQLAGWPGARIIQDNVLWKPPGAKSLGFHRDNAYLAWYKPREMLSCWIALDDTTAASGTLELARGSHRWPTGADPASEFHAPKDYTESVSTAGATARALLDIAPIEVQAGSGAFHHGWTWHGSGPNRSPHHRRALVLHCGSSEARFCRQGFGDGNGPVYSRYAHLCDDEMDENYFPVLWTRDGYRTPGI